MKNLNSVYNDPERVKIILQDIFPDYDCIFKEMKDLLGGLLPAELSFGLVAGYLRGKGHSWEAAFLGMDKHIEICNKYSAIGEPSNREFKIEANSDGSVDVSLKDIK